MKKQLITTTVLFAGVLGLSVSISGQREITPSALRNHPAIAYATTPPDDPVAQLDRALRAGTVKLAYDPQNGYLTSVLEALGIQPASQVLVFSKTSFQAAKIGPQNPRALFFNDAVVVGWVRGGEVLEFLAQDPRQGSMFYTMANSAEGPPELRRNMVCVACHTGEMTLNVPGMMIGSVYPEKDGTAGYTVTYTTDHRSPYEIRWGGWYVTGRHHEPRHMGNAVVTDRDNMLGMVTPATLHVDSLAGKFDTTGYPAQSSDIIALMLIEHQSAMSNLITRVGWEARVGAEVGRPLQEAVNDLVDYLLFIDEAPLAGPIDWSPFARQFNSVGPYDGRGRSLRNLDLTHRLLRYPCSYMIYSDAFDALPALAKAAVYARLWDVLNGQAMGPRYARLSSDDRQAILEILRSTKKDLPSYFAA
jgi:hypothetical protein